MSVHTCAVTGGCLPIIIIFNAEKHKHGVAAHSKHLIIVFKVTKCEIHRLKQLDFLLINTVNI